MTDRAAALQAAVVSLIRGDLEGATAIARSAGLKLEEVRAELALLEQTQAEIRAGEDADKLDLYHHLGAKLLSEVDGSPAPPLILNRIDPEGHTILFGPGDVGKGVEASRLIAELTRGGERALVVDYEGHQGEWRRRVGGFGGDVREVMIAQPASPEWGGARGAIWKHATELAQLRNTFEARFTFVDSIVAATTGLRDPYAPDAPQLYGEALQTVGGHVVSLAHCNRSDDMRYPFGSIFWHNFARTTWSMETKDGRRLLTHRKKGNRESLGEWEVDFRFDDVAGVITAAIEPWRSEASRERDERLDEAIDLVPADGDGKTLAELGALWGLGDTGVAKRVAALEAQGRLRHEKQPRPGGGFRNTYWSVPPFTVRKVPS